MTSPDLVFPDLDEIRGRYGRIAADLDVRVGRVRRLDWNSVTPCSNWNSRDLMAHVVDTHRRVLATLTGEPADEVTDHEDVVEAWRAVTAEMSKALAEDEKALFPVRFFGSESEFANLVGGLLCSDTLIHTWDLCQAAGLEDTLDAAGVDHAMALLTRFGEGIRSPDGFGPEIPAPAVASAQDRLMLFAGRPVIGLD
ncbi:TIGR03086 family metal-binding protein [Sporichthya sp.]|uniref:TIGR03086 family metal-binding protein n=1 Tax=Sporichthya sp. TaxID=65475 RepID=UPI001790E178|nr:TIGR03086 family metal-binding protein [Sporichthya sp.]MBA3742724.1 TIGR03086 family protein [Sporichthya sp.]